MSKLPPLAITTCRVSSEEQLKNNSLQRQARAVRAAATELGAIIPKDGQWSGSVSSKAGKNVHRKDLKEMLRYIKRNPRVKYLIVHKVDRFMRSMDELFFFEVTFRIEGVKIWYADEPEMNTNDFSAKRRKAEKVFQAEASNEERYEKSIDGLTGALEEGRYPFVPPTGYRKGHRNGIPEIDETRGIILQENLQYLYASRDPRGSLKALNDSAFTEDNVPLKMDKYRKIATNIFYAGFVFMNKQVKVEPTMGLHEPLITLEQHREILRIFESKKKNQSGPMVKGNPRYPLSNLVSCEPCINKRNGRYVGFKHSNGSKNGPIYEKYRCRSCGRYITRTELHEKVSAHIASLNINEDFMLMLENELLDVWKLEEEMSRKEVANLKRHIEQLQKDIEIKADAIIDPANAPIKQVLLDKVSANNSRIKAITEKINTLESVLDIDREKFVSFAMSYVRDSSGILLSEDFDKFTREECKQLLFPQGFYLNVNNKVYTPEISPIYRLRRNKKDPPDDEKSFMVRVKRL